MAPSVAEPAAISTEVEWQESACRTPTGAECRIPEPTTCPPAPRKLRSESSGDNSWRRYAPAPATKFFLPKAADLEKIFNVHTVG
ncbi:hypothetical protein KFK09_012419 [Dendrobium nobile]|uniref:Uncharacterized protein n=1 Tax=Dendrobium nobile TaxID=94219 RepID=A0A8T3BHT5_DENNO|nr:hypothetical protein KFK09_012419 [Dendrobium nobile]